MKSEAIYHSIKVLSSMCTLIFFQRFIALQNGEDLILKVHSTSCLKHIRTKIKMQLLGKSHQNFEEIRNDVWVYEQKPIKIDDFNKAEKKEIKERVEKKIKKERSRGK